MSSAGFEKPIVFRKEDDDNDDGSHDTYNIHEKNRYDLNSKIMLTAIISLSVVVVLVLALHIYARYVLRRQARRRRAAIHHLGITVSQSRSADHQQPPKTGLHRSVIDSLPIFTFQSTSSSMAECAVCLSALDDGEMARLLPNCKHIFHVECIDKWLSSQSTCPICRTEVEPRRIVLEPEPREGPVESTTSPSAPPVERLNSVSSRMELATSSGHDSGKVVVNNTSGGNNSTRLSSFRRILSRERSSRRIQPCGQQDDQDVIEDLERQ